MIYRKFKRIMDVLVTSISLIVLAPLFIVLAIVIKLSSKGPVLFLQRRIGRDNNEFRILKFRTMRVDAPQNMPTHLLKNPEMHITRIGGLLRKTSLDELPQLWNVFVGDMSLVGPRPALWNQYDLIEKRTFLGVHKILPGITGWAQINGRDELSIEEKSNYDNEYMHKMSLFMDITCLIKTITTVFCKNGIVEGRNG